MEFITPTIRPGDLECARAPKGQLPPTTTNEQAAERIVQIDEAGEDCRLKLDKVKTKIETFNEIVEQYDAKKAKRK